MKFLQTLLIVTLITCLSCSSNKDDVEVIEKHQQSLNLRKQLGLPEQTLTKEEIEEIKRTVKPIKFETVEEAKAFLDNLEKSFEENSIKTISEEEYQKAIKLDNSQSASLEENNSKLQTKSRSILRLLRSRCNQGIYISHKHTIRPGCHLRFNVQYGIHRVNTRTRYLELKVNRISASLYGFTYGLSYKLDNWRSYPRRASFNNSGAYLSFHTHGTVIVHLLLGKYAEVYRYRKYYGEGFSTCRGSTF